MKIAVVTSSNAAAMSQDDPILLAALQRAGHQTFHWRWDDPDADWGSVDVALVRSTWDYFERASEFVPWLERASSQVRFVNDAAILRWNLDKHYLAELLSKGLPVLPTQIASHAELAEAAQPLWDEGQSVIIKPVISGGSVGLHHLQPGQALEVDPGQAPYLVQPFVPSVATKGELSVILLGGEVSHGIRKVPRAGDIRVQKEYGGQYQVETPPAEAVATARAILQACPGQPLYARADMVERAGRYELMEMELLEPELFFALVPEAADRLAALL